MKTLYKKLFKKYDDKISTSYGDNKLSTEKINLLREKFDEGLIDPDKLIEEYNKFIINAEKFKDVMKQRKQGAITPN